VLHIQDSTNQLEFHPPQGVDSGMEKGWDGEWETSKNGMFVVMCRLKCYNLNTHHIIVFLFQLRGALMRKAETLIEPLTQREQEILALLAKHQTNKEIATRLSLSVNSVKWYARQIYGKLGVENRRQAAARAGVLGLLETVTEKEQATSLYTSSDTGDFTNCKSKPRHNLPLQLTSFIGRGVEIEQVKKLLGRSRLVTLTGAGGVGKTRLALAVAPQILDEFKDGIWLVELASVGDPQIIAETIAAVFRVRADQNRSLRTALLEYLREKQLLLILDNCEHLIDACAEITDTILRTCPQVYLLASSREALGIEGEAPLYVPSLSFPEPAKLPRAEDLEGYESVRLFVERARVVVPGFAITESNAICLAQICHRLDGIPLAMELAAARLQVLSLDQIAERLDDRFRLLTGGSRRALPRHQTLHALIDWSYELLSEKERILFRRLSVFAGSWTLEAAEAVCTEGTPVESLSSRKMLLDLPTNEIIDFLAGLVNKSLIVVIRQGDEIRGYRMLETVRQYAQEKLVEAGEAERFRDRHLDFFLKIAEESEPLLRGPELLDRLEQLDHQIDNIRLALSWAMGGKSVNRVVKGLRLGNALEFYWYARSILSEGIEWLKKGLSIIPKEESHLTHLRARVLFGISFLVMNTVDFTRVNEVSLLLEESISLFQECNDRLGRAMAQARLGLCLMFKYITSFGPHDEREEYAMACALGEQGLADCREFGQPSDVAIALTMNLYICSIGNELQKARAFGDEALAICEKCSDKIIMEMILIRLAELSISQIDLQGAQQYTEKLFLLAQELEDKIGIINALIISGMIAYFSQEFTAMELRYQASSELSRETGALIYQMFSLRNLGIATLRQRNLQRSREYYLENFYLAEKANWLENEWAKYDVNTFILGMGGIALELGDITQAARLLGTVEAQFESFFKPLDVWDLAEFNRIAGQVRQRLNEASFTSSWSAGRELSLEQAIAEARQVMP
jgi:predicted ATPase/DNA-binding CsgD family transcriptional regulator